VAKTRSSWTTPSTRSGTGVKEPCTAREPGRWSLKQRGPSRGVEGREDLGSQEDHASYRGRAMS
jgi:hypothetical protein